jgi:eukaryotic-like serine/threonine-protein kinase
MGAVYLAEQQQPIRRIVALKLIKPGMDTRAVMARFESERALPLTEYPNIARVFDAGSGSDGRQYFVMEYVPGIPITEYCDQNRLTNRERLELFLPVCQAVQHAHQKGIIHRDIKPSNVLVSAQDGVPVPKVVDFGWRRPSTRNWPDRNDWQNTTLSSRSLVALDGIWAERSEPAPRALSSLTVIGAGKGDVLPA